MAQTNFTPILTYRSNTAAAVPSAGNLTNSANGAELAVNTADKRLFTKDSGGNVVEIGTNPSSVTLPNGTANGVVYANGSKVLTTGSALTFDGTNLGIGTSSPGARLQVTGTGKATIFGSVTAQNSYSAWQYNSTDVGYIGNGGAVVSGAAATDFGITAFTSGKLWLGSNNGASYAVLDSSGNLGLGVTPSAWDSGYKSFDNAAGSLANSSTSYQFLTFNGYVNGGAWKYRTSSTTALQYAQYSGQHVWNTAGAGTAGNAITWTQAMTLDASGNLLVGTTSRISSERLGVTFAAGSQGIAINVASGATQTQVLFANSFGGVGSITTSGSATAYNTSSDYRLKNITGPITNSGAYIDSLNPVEGTWKADGSTFVGLIAHEVQEASRTTVATGVKDGEQMQGMDYSSAEIIANLIAEVKSLRKRLAAAGI